MATPMETNVNNLSDSNSDSDLVDPAMYKKMIGSLMYLVNTTPYICFAVNNLSLLHIKITHFDSVASVVITKCCKCRILLTRSQVSYVAHKCRKNIKKACCHDAYVVPITT
jgi:hypothetical protein